MMGKKKSNKKVVIIMLIILLLGLAVGYAAFSDVLTVSGTANAKGTFDLEFQNAEVVKAVGVNEAETTAVISTDKNTLTVKAADLSYPGAGVEYAVDIVNVGTIPAKVNEIKVSNLTGTEHIEIKGLEVIDTEHPIINSKDKCNIHFTVEWPKEKATEIAENEEATFELQIEYVQATTESFDGKASHEDVEGNTAGGGEIVEPTVKTGKLIDIIDGVDYGKSINYKATVQGEEVSNWKIFHNDGTNVYIILDDYLPNKLVPTSTGLEKQDTTQKYNVYSSTSKVALVSALETQRHWREFANGVSGAMATGSPTIEQFVASWNANPAVNERQLEARDHYYGSNIVKPISDPTKLYIPHTESMSYCGGYWLASLDNPIESVLSVERYGYVRGTSYGNGGLGVRPVVCLPSDTLGIVGDKVEIEIEIPSVEEPEIKTGKLTEIIAGEDYGKIINYKATVRGATISNWKVFHNDGTNVYIILADYLPNTLVPEEAGLTKGDTRPYSVWHESSRDALVDALSTQFYWSEFANGVDGATATGGPTNEQFVASWNANPALNGMQLQPETRYEINDPTKLYMPYNTGNLYNCRGYWLASLYHDNYSDEPFGVWRVFFNGVTPEVYSNKEMAVRPVVCLPSNVIGTVGDIVEIK